MAERERIPLHLITGFLGVGKTTALMGLLARRTASDRWAVIVNEYGEVGIDGSLLSAEEVTVEEVAGGCVCCTAAVHFQFALAHVVENVRPTRLFVETTGVGHPARLLDDLRRPAWADRVDVRAVIGLISPDDFENPEMATSEVFRDQIELADILLMNKADRVSAELRRRFLQWGEALNPPKVHIGLVEQGFIDVSWLDLGAVPDRRALFPELHGHAEASAVAESLSIDRALPGRPLRKESRGPGGHACGWIFHVDDVFDEDRLLKFLSSNDSILRLKGIFRTDGGWFSVNRSGRETVVMPSGHRRDSRLEVFAWNVAGGWAEYEKGLLASRKEQPG